MKPFSHRSASLIAILLLVSIPPGMAQHREIGSTPVPGHTPKPYKVTIAPTTVAKVIPQTPQTIVGLSVNPDANFADFQFRTTQATVPIINISKRPPLPGPRFDQTVSGAFPIFAKGVVHNLRVSKLEPGRKYYYIVTAAANDGKLITATGSFRTAVIIDNGPALVPADR
jgi:hypothetical protein